MIDAYRLCLFLIGVFLWNMAAIAGFGALAMGGLFLWIGILLTAAFFGAGLVAFMQSVLPKFTARVFK